MCHMSMKDITQGWVQDKHTVSWSVFYGTFSTNRLYHAIEVGNVSHRVGGEHKYHAVK